MDKMVFGIACAVMMLLSVGAIVWVWKKAERVVIEVQKSKDKIKN